MIDCKELVRRVRVLINETADDEEVSLLSADTRSLDKTILEMLPQAVAFIQHNKGIGAGCVNLKSVKNLNISHFSGGGLMLLPEDFELLVSLKLERWKSPVHTIHAIDSREAAWQQNEFTVAGCCKPVCVESFTPGGVRCALLYPFANDDSSIPEHFIYEARFNASEGLESRGDSIVDSVVYMCASLVYTMFERHDCANSMLALALAACGGKSFKK
jgi:hypothetical protein